jgi:hypothetical protein
MSTEESKELVLRLVHELWNEHEAAAIDRSFAPGLGEEVAEHYQQLLGGSPDLKVPIEGELNPPCRGRGDELMEREASSGLGPVSAQTGSVGAEVVSRHHHMW